MKLFIAFDIPKKIDLTKIQNYIAKGAPKSDGLDAILGKDAKFVPTKQPHLTLVFIGAQPESKIQSIKDAFFEAVEEFVDKQQRGMIEFSLKNGAAVMGVNAVTMNGTIAERAFELQQILIQKFKQDGVRIDARPWIPHLTLGRINPALVIKKKIATIEPFLETVRVPDKLDMFTLNSITLYDATQDGYQVIDTLKI